MNEIAVKNRALKGVFAKPIIKSNQIMFRVTDVQKLSIKAAAKSVSLGISEYLIQLHEFAVSNRKRL